MEKLNSDQYHIMLGTLLGNGCITKDNRLNMQHTLDKEIYLISKTLHFSNLASNNPIEYKGNIVRWRSRSSVIWQRYSHIKKNISMNILDQLRDISLAVWYQDKGRLQGYRNRHVCLRTQSFLEAGNRIIHQYFNEVGLECSMQKERKSFVVVFTTQASKQFLKIVAPYIHPTLYKKLLAIE